MKAGLDPGFETRALPRTDLIPFESEHRCMGTLHHDHDGRGFIFVKGAPERIIERAVKGMLPKGPLGRNMYRKLKVYAGSEHRHAAQQPEPLAL